MLSSTLAYRRKTVGPTTTVHFPHSETTCVFVFLFIICPSHYVRNLMLCCWHYCRALDLGMWLLGWGRGRRSRKEQLEIWRKSHTNTTKSQNAFGELFTLTVLITTSKITYSCYFFTKENLNPQNNICLQEKKKTMLLKVKVLWCLLFEVFYITELTYRLILKEPSYFKCSIK